MTAAPPTSSGPVPPLPHGVTDADSPYMPQLDALRAVAVAAVLVEHFKPGWGAWVTAVRWGSIGVQLFFVLSGFLITGILLRCRALGSTGQGAGATLGRFYARRALRIFPAYFLTLAVAYAAGIGSIRHTIGWHAAYLSNVYMALRGQWDGEFSHFWSLAVEEQFYLVWPLLLLFLPARRLKAAMVVAVVLAPVFRTALVLAGAGEVAVRTPVFSCVDALGLGSLLAVLWRTDPAGRWRTQLYRAAWCSLPLLAALLAMKTAGAPGGERLYLALFNTPLALAFAALVDRTARGFGGRFGALLASRPLTYPGKISYGVYVYHLFMPRLVLYGAALLGLPAHKSHPAFFAACCAATFVLAAASWHLLESPLNRLKAYFPYRQSAEPWGGGRARRRRAAPRTLSAATETTVEVEVATAGPPGGGRLPGFDRGAG